MRRLAASSPTTGDTPAIKENWDDLTLPSPWLEVISILRPGTRPRPVQVMALRDQAVLTSRRNLIVSSPTNSGKTLIGTLCLLDAIHRGHRAVLLEPMRALAREKADELTVLAPRLGACLGRPFTVTLTTGDYRRDAETFRSPPPDRGELVIATPERMEALLRNPNHLSWLKTVGAVGVDEAHLLGDSRRGATLEYLLTSLRCLPVSPRLILLSATIGSADRLQAWLPPCDLILRPERDTPLTREVLDCDEGEDADTILMGEIEGALSGSLDNRVLVFVYQTRSAEALARHLTDGGIPALPYHSRLSSSARQEAVERFRQGNGSRCLVATSALGLGVNLPASHVYVRDTALPGNAGGEGRLRMEDFLQMTGRAGRGDTPGYAAVLLRPHDPWTSEELTTSLRHETVSDITSAFIPLIPEKYHPRRTHIKNDEAPARVAPFVAALLARHPEEGCSLEEIRAFFERSLGGTSLAAFVPVTLAWLAEPTRLLAYQHPDTANYCLTVLGRRATQSVIPLPVAAGIGQLIRDLLTMDEDDELLDSWRPLDHLLVLSLLHAKMPGSRTPRPYTAALTASVDAWMERNQVHMGQSLLYRRWIAGTPDASRAREVLGSLGLSLSARERDISIAAHRASYLALFRTILLYDRAQGTETGDLERAWGIQNWEGVEEYWRDELLWLLSGVAELLELRTFYYHLCDTCGADWRRIQRVKRILRTLRRQALELRNDLTYCSPLGPALRGLRDTLRADIGRKIGTRTIRRLEEAGIRSLESLALLPSEKLTAVGVSIAFVRQIERYLRHRQQ